MDLIVLHGEPPVAFMQCWKGMWPIKITKAEGWKGTTSMEDTSRLRRWSKPRGTNGRPGTGPRGNQLVGRTGHTSAQARARVARSLPRCGTSAIAERYLTCAPQETTVQMMGKL